MHKCHAVYKSKREINQLITYQGYSNYTNVCLKHKAMFQQIDLSLKAVNNSIVRLNWALNENEEYSLIHLVTTLFDKSFAV